MANGKFRHLPFREISLFVGSAMALVSEFLLVPAANAAESMSATVTSVVIIDKDTLQPISPGEPPQTGDFVEITVSVTSTGGVHHPSMTAEIDGHTVSIDPATCTLDGDSGFPVTLNKNASFSCTITYQLTSPVPDSLQLSVDGGACSNNKDETCASPDVQFSADFPIELVSPLVLTKSVSPDVVTAPNTLVTYTYVIRNVGASPLFDVEIHDVSDGSKQLDSFICTGVNYPIATLAGEASVTCTSTYEISPDDYEQEVVNNTAQASGVDSISKMWYSNQFSAKVSIAKLFITKLVSSVGTPNLSLRADVPSFESSVTYSFAITNNGSVEISSVDIQDSVISSDPLSKYNPQLVTCSPDSDSSGLVSGNSLGSIVLQPDGTVICTVSYTTKTDDFEQCNISNTAIAVGKYAINGVPGSGEVDSIPSDPAYLDLQVPSSELYLSVPTVSPSSSIKSGDSLQYTFTLSNTGPVDLSQLTFSTDQVGTVSLSGVSCNYLAGASFDFFSGILAAGETVHCTQDYLVTDSDVQTGQVVMKVGVVGLPDPATSCDSPVDSDPNVRTITTDIPGFEPAPTSTEPTSTTAKPTSTAPTTSPEPTASPDRHRHPVYQPTLTAPPLPSPTLTPMPSPTAQPTCNPQTGECVSTGGSIEASNFPRTAGLGLLGCLAGAAYVIRRRTVQVQS